MTKLDDLQSIAQQIKDCTLCPLSKTATNPVPGNGDPNAEIMFIGEAPGFNEDQQGIPFCGRSGKLLDELLASINLDRSKVFVANVLKHRPPDNRDPLPEEIQVCKDYLDKQIEIINPKVIIGLGRFAMMKFLPLGKITRDHGVAQTIEYNSKKYIFIPMFHPAAALRATGVDQQIREDFLKIRQEIEKIEKLQNPIMPSEEPKPTDPEIEQLTLV